jgi:hypothetical protein
MEKICVLDDEKICDDCGDCMKCDLDPTKVCDNCMQCVKKSDADYLAIEIDEVINAASPDEAPEFPIKSDKADSAKERAADSGTLKASALKGARPKKPRKSPS